MIEMLDEKFKKILDSVDILDNMKCNLEVKKKSIFLKKDKNGQEAVTEKDTR